MFGYWFKKLYFVFDNFYISYFFSRWFINIIYFWIKFSNKKEKNHNFLSLNILNKKNKHKHKYPDVTSW